MSYLARLEEKIYEQMKTKHEIFIENTKETTNQLL